MSPFYCLHFFFIVASLIISASYCEIMFKGITFVGDKYCPEVSFDSPLAFESLANLARTGANYVAFVVTEYQDYKNSTTIYPIYSDYPKNKYYTYKTETIPAITAIIKEAHRLGLKVMLKPHIDLSKEPRYEVVWRGNIGGFTQEEHWAQWFESYEAMIIKYAKLAEELKVEMFSVSCELISVNSKETYWRNIIANIRKVYSGLLTSSANHSGEEVSKKWWDALDFIGVDAYYLSIKPSAYSSLFNQLDTRLQTIANTLESLSKKYQKDVIITEIGACSGKCVINNRNTVPEVIDHFMQGYYYDKFMSVFSKKPFIKGFFWWAWNSDPNTGGYSDHCITPQMKPAEFVLYQHYGGQTRNIRYTPKGEPKCLCTI